MIFFHWVERRIQEFVPFLPSLKRQTETKRRRKGQTEPLGYGKRRDRPDGYRKMPGMPHQAGRADREKMEEVDIYIYTERTDTEKGGVGKDGYGKGWGWRGRIRKRAGWKGRIRRRTR